jgi:BirA family biotin operon repressor/biotin-[acetyl-CoA-carboxylase] ligase
MENDLIERLQQLPLGKIAYFKSVGSTNDIVAAWAIEGAPEFSLAVADEQTKGRGRSGRSWYTPSGATLTFSILLKPAMQDESSSPARASALGALALCQALEDGYSLAPAIKWPNDVLLEEMKISGILAEAHWLGDKLQAVVLGMGINLAPSSLPPAESLTFPASYLEAHAGGQIDRGSLLRSILENMLDWKPEMNAPEFIQAWENRLAFKGQTVRLFSTPADEVVGRLIGLSDAGHLKLQTADGELRLFQAGEIHLRPHVDR